MHPLTAQAIEMGINEASGSGQKLKNFSDNLTAKKKKISLSEQNNMGQSSALHSMVFFNIEH